MAGELARMFASLGFNVDPTGADLFESKLRTLRQNSALLARNLGVVGDKLDVVKKKVIALNSAMNKDTKVSKNGGATSSYSKMSKYVDNVTKSQEKLVTQSPILIDKLDKLRASVWKGSNAWEAYAKNIQKAKADMSGFHQIAGIGKTGRVTVNNRVYGQGGGSGYAPRPHTPTSTDSGGMGMTALFAGGFRDFFRSMTPATAIAGGAVSAGYAVKETVQAGREMTKMNNVLLMASENTTQYAKALEFVNKESNRLGQDVQEMGMAFGKVMQSGRDKMKFTDIQKVFTGFGELMTAMGANVDDQKGIYRAFGQMLTKGKVEAEEEGQMAERGLPAKDLIKKASMKVYGVDAAGYESMRKKGAVKIEDIAVELAASMSLMARNNDALNKMLNTSAVQQQRFMNEWKKFAQAVMDSGLDKSLAYIFKGLTTVLEASKPFIQGLSLVVGTIYDMIAAFGKWYTENAKLAGSLTTISALLVVLKVSLFSATGATYALGTAATALWVRYGRLLIRFGLITAAVWGLYEAFSALQRNKEGQINWVTMLGAEFGVLFGKIDVTTAKLEQFFTMLRYYSRYPTDFFKNLTGKDIEEATINASPAAWLFNKGKNLYNKLSPPDKVNESSAVRPPMRNDNLNILINGEKVATYEKNTGYGDLTQQVRVNLP